MDLLLALQIGIGFQFNAPLCSFIFAWMIIHRKYKQEK
jgi:hypothetical protein